MRYKKERNNDGDSRGRKPLRRKTEEGAAGKGTSEPYPQILLCSKNKKIHEG